MNNNKKKNTILKEEEKERTPSYKYELYHIQCRKNIITIQTKEKCL